MFSDTNQYCMVCMKNPATVFFEVYNEKKKIHETKALCLECAKNFFNEELNLPKNNEFVDVVNDLRKMLSGIIDNIIELTSIANSVKKEEKKQTIKCNNCGHTLKQFKESGLLGCPYCYNYFSSELNEFFLELERNTRHNGRMPENFLNIYLIQKEILYLQNKLNKLIKTENYEEAEKVKKRLEKLSGLDYKR